MTKIKFLIFLIILCMFIGCTHSNDNPIQSNTKIRISFQITPEDLNSKTFSIKWIDTLGQSEGYLNDNINWVKRPQEIWCIITNLNNDTLGYYQGLSTAQSFTYFHSTDSIVVLNFMIGLNFFSDKFEHGKDKESYEKAAKEYSDSNNLPINFEPVSININKDLSRLIDIELKQK